MKRVLLIEEDPAIRMVLAAFLRNWADSIHAVGNICEARMHISEGTSFDVFVCDAQFFTSECDLVLEILRTRQMESIPWLLTTELARPLPENMTIRILPRPFLPGDLHRSLDGILQ